MNVETIERLRDARTAATKAQQCVGDRSEDQYLADEGLNLIVERLLEVLGETLNVAQGYQPELEQAIPDLRIAVSVRHRIIHGYDKIDHVVLFETVTKSLPHLIEQIDTVRNDI